MRHDVLVITIFFARKKGRVYNVHEKSSKKMSENKPAANVLSFNDHDTEAKIIDTNLST